MSMRLMTRIWDDGPEDISPVELLVLLALADHANDAGKCWPSAARVAKRARISQRHAIRVIHDLRDRGYLSIEERPGRSSLFTITVPTTSEPTPDTVSPMTLDVIPTPDTQMSPEPLSEPPLSVKEAREEIDAGFTRFWSYWPRKVAKPTARRAFLGAVKRSSIKHIVSAAKGYADNPHRPEQRYIPHPSTWLNRDGWDDELPGPSERSSSGRPTAFDRAASLAARLRAAEAPSVGEVDW